ncbi:Flp family type IVb pilin [Pseudomonas kulmbachensis]|uniref:Flp family type IVb pilin n=1 Tax=Pseudomonas kulmbachensis TaxID=3043408 RepID=UPI002AB00FF3|nr:Flp family type IVb pilin [Pseudomonas sp. FLM 004-28]
MMLNTVLRVYIPAQAFVAGQIKSFIKRTEGASGIEYAIIAAMVAVVIAGFSVDVQKAVTDIFDEIKVGLAMPA